MTHLLLLSLGAACGGMARHHLGSSARPRRGILVANVIACGLLGAVGVLPQLIQIGAVSAAGTLSTWSTLASQAGTANRSNRVLLLFTHLALGSIAFSVTHTLI